MKTFSPPRYISPKNFEALLESLLFDNETKFLTTLIKKLYHIITIVIQKHLSKNNIEI